MLYEVWCTSTNSFKTTFAKKMLGITYKKLIGDPDGIQITEEN